MWMRLEDVGAGVESEDGNWEVGLITQAELSTHTEHRTAKTTTTGELITPTTKPTSKHYQQQ